MVDLDALDRLNAERTRTDYGWWAGEPYCGTFGPVGVPDERNIIRSDSEDMNTRADVWAGDPNNDDDNSPLIGEFGDHLDARFVAALVTHADELLRLARIGAAHDNRSASEDGSQGT